MKQTLWDRVFLVSGGHPSAWASRIGLEKTTVWAWKRGGTRGPQAATLARLVEKTGIPAEWWLHGTGEIPPEAARRFGLAPAVVELQAPAPPAPPRPALQAVPAPPPGAPGRVDMDRMTKALRIILGLLAEANLTNVAPDKISEMVSISYELLQIYEDEDRVADSARALMRLVA